MKKLIRKKEFLEARNVAAVHTLFGKLCLGVLVMPLVDNPFVSDYGIISIAAIMICFLMIRLR